MQKHSHRMLLEDPGILYVQIAKVVRLSLKTNFSGLERVAALGRLVAYHNN
jgi:hypothetical protein